MDAFPTAADMLIEIKTESLQHLLMTIRQKTAPVGATYIPKLDAILSAQEQQSSCPASSIDRGDVLEIQGPAASGKSQLLYHLVITCIMPSRYQSVNIGGWDKAAVLFDNDGTFHIESFHSILLSRLTSLIPDRYRVRTPNSVLQLVSDPAEDLAAECLTKLHIFKPTSSIQLAATLLHLPQYHSSHPALQSREIGLVAIDSISAFHWNDRFTVERSRNARKVRAADPASHLLHILAALRSFRVSHGAAIVVTNWGLNPLKSSAHTGQPALPFYKQHLHPFPSPFERPPPMLQSARPDQDIEHSYPPRSSSPLVDQEQQLQRATARDFDSQHVQQILPLTHHITLHPLSIDPLSANSTLAESEEQNASRCTIVKRREVLGFVRTPHSAESGEFSFFITERGVLAEPSLDR